ncbi:MarR family transcriptional regulator [Arthrobacter sp. StoSoilB5]|uniref:MarR family winged helix-turn-helix transcriptional regulator n=1 Tax=Arthrobacter sp. StoSoilB5 TaxID=2830992 RepID=UPI001CC7D7A4|nr:MarR family transcriptional regulator [Arthrobacter sp. StoSoilB5]BCW43047.1 MarR family transcriptional regulator [Arthrobacter sp. StoSoilB5]
MVPVTPSAESDAAESDVVELVIEDWRRERPDLDPSAIAVFGRLLRVVAAQRAVQDSIYEPYGLTLASFDVLANLRRSGPPHRKTAGELANSSMLTTGGITFRLDRMEEQNLIERVRSREDRRVVFAQMTEHGKALIDEVISKHFDTQHNMLAGLTPEEVEQLAVLLKKAELSIAAFDSQAAPAPEEVSVNG